jgi:outer membrane immunogenic protein
VLKKLALASTALVVLAGAAAAADLPRERPMAPVAPIAPVFTWSGFYLGTHTGGIFTDTTVRTSGNTAGAIADIAANRRPASISLEESALMSGVQVGYNMQFGPFVAGIEADLSYTDLDSHDSFISTFDDPSVFRQELDFFGTVRGRVGVAFDRVLVYATGGLAYADVTNRVAFLRNTDGAFQFTGHNSDVEFGYTVGGGVEFALPPELQRFFFIGTLLGATGVTVKAEYLYFDLGDRDVAVNAVGAGGVGSFTSRFETTGHVGRIGFNYRFGTY